MGSRTLSGSTADQERTGAALVCSSRQAAASASGSWLSSMFHAKQRPRRFPQRLRRSLAGLGNVLNFRLGVKAGLKPSYTCGGKKKKEATVAEVRARISELIESPVTRYASAKD